jgi:hypothetical protein
MVGLRKLHAPTAARPWSISGLKKKKETSNLAGSSAAKTNGNINLWEFKGNCSPRELYQINHYRRPWTGVLNMGLYSRNEPLKTHSKQEIAHTLNTPYIP